LMDSPKLDFPGRRQSRASPHGWTSTVVRGRPCGRRRDVPAGVVRHRRRVRALSRTTSTLHEALEPPLNRSAVDLVDVPLLEQQLLPLVWKGRRITHPAVAAAARAVRQKAPAQIWRPRVGSCHGADELCRSNGTRSASADEDVAVRAPFSNVSAAETYDFLTHGRTAQDIVSRFSPTSLEQPRLRRHPVH